MTDGRPVHPTDIEREESPFVAMDTEFQNVVDWVEEAFGGIDSDLARLRPGRILERMTGKQAD